MPRCLPPKIWYDIQSGVHLILHLRRLNHPTWFKEPTVTVQKCPLCRQKIPRGHQATYSMERSLHPHTSQNLKNLTVWFKDYEVMGNCKEPRRGRETRTFRNIYQVGRREERVQWEQCWVKTSSDNYSHCSCPGLCFHPTVGNRSPFLSLGLCGLRLKLQLHLSVLSNVSWKSEAWGQAEEEGPDSNVADRQAGSWTNTECIESGPFISYFQQEQMWIYLRAKQGRW